MKRNKLHILIVILMISQVISIVKINDLQRQIENTNVEMYRSNNSLINKIDAIYANVDERLRREASPFESVTTEIGKVNPKELTVPVSITLTPKEVSQHTAVSLDFDGELIPMERKDTTFSATVSCDVFGSFLPKIVIEENGVKKTTRNDRIGVRSIKHSIFPALYARLSGEARYSNNTYKRKGELNVNIKEANSAIQFTEIRFVIKVDDQVISEKIIPQENISTGFEVDEVIPLNSGQVCTMTVIAKDNVGLEHHYLVDHWVAGSGYQMEPRIDDGEIYTPDGKLLWKPGIDLVSNSVHIERGDGMAFWTPH